MKYVLLLLLISSMNQLAAQRNRYSLSISIDGYKDTICRSIDGFLTGRLTNESQYPIITPYGSDNSTSAALAKIYASEMFYEIIYCNKAGNDTLFKGSHTIGFDRSDTRIRKFNVLEVSKSKKIPCTLDYGYFRKIGTYKIRFGFKASQLNKCYQDVYSDWITVYVKNPDFINTE
jgi:hypothetical protein